MLFLLALLHTPRASAHSWVEQMQLISSNGTYMGDPGYPRGYMARTDPGFNGYSDKWQLPSPDHDLGRLHINSTDSLCHPAQRTANYTSQYPKLQVSPNSYVAMRYLENGHVTQPWIPAGKPAGSGTVFVYGTYSPAADEKIVDVLQWTTDGKGGNGKGFLMTAQNYDDGRCHQPNSAPISIQRQIEFPDKVPGQESWCETDLHIPQDSKTGSTLTVYWVWSWQTQTHTEGAPCGKDEYYTTCADVDIVAGSEDKLLAAAKVHTLIQQDPQVTAVSDFKSRTAYATTPNLVTTEACTITSVTSSALPASLTQMTTLPERFWQTYTDNIASQAAPTTSSSRTSTATGIASTTSSSGMTTVTVTVPSVQTVTVSPSSTSTAHALPFVKGGFAVADKNGVVSEAGTRRAMAFVA